MINDITIIVPQDITFEPPNATKYTGYDQIAAASIIFTFNVNMTIK